MKTKLEYEFKDNEDDARFYMITNAENLYWSLYDLNRELHDLVKYTEKAESQNLDIDTLDHVRSMLHGIMEDHGVDLEHVT